MTIGEVLLLWIVPFIVGFAIGGVYFLSMKVQVDYVVKKKGPEWLVPAMMYARMVFIAAILIVVARTVPKEHAVAVVVMGLFGAIVARILVARMVKKGSGDNDG